MDEYARRARWRYVEIREDSDGTEGLWDNENEGLNDEGIISGNESD